MVFSLLKDGKKLARLERRLRNLGPTVQKCSVKTRKGRCQDTGLTEVRYRLLQG